MNFSLYPKLHLCFLIQIEMVAGDYLNRKQVKNLFCHATRRFFFPLVVRRVFEDYGNILSTAVRVVNRPSGFLKHFW